MITDSQVKLTKNALAKMRQKNRTLKCTTMTSDVDPTLMVTIDSALDEIAHQFNNSVENQEDDRADNG